MKLQADALQAIDEMVVDEKLASRADLESRDASVTGDPATMQQRSSVDHQVDRIGANCITHLFVVSWIGDLNVDELQTWWKETDASFRDFDLCTGCFL